MRIVLFVSLLIIFLSQTNQKAFAKEDTATHSKQAQKTTSKSKLPDSAKVICYSNVSNALELPNDARAFEGNNITLGLVEDDLPLNGYSKDDLNNGLKVYFKRPGSAFFEVYTHSAVGAFVASENEEYSYCLKNINFDKTNDMLSYQIVKKSVTSVTFMTTIMTLSALQNFSEKAFIQYSLTHTPMLYFSKSHRPIIIRDNLTRAI